MEEDRHKEKIYDKLTLVLMNNRERGLNGYNIFKQ